MRKMILAAVAVFGLGAATKAPAFAEGEGNGEPFPGASFAVSAGAMPAYANRYAQRDVGSEQYPSTVGRPGTNLSALANDQVLPAQSNEAVVQTANSLPRGFEDGTVAYAQAQSINAWMVAHNQAAPSSFAAR